ncbi:LPXTG-motif cell wall anchor domain-containing protein/fibro-slime domain-containing protein [Pseudobutyrivibrio sp. 49]|uniref:SpaA isopeptide-forming pilin-related protein n=1 Tax=Pseudobutyrivibrio sp. 49 TaxID=1855344 RepID=UPI000891243B|nr:SpaA isopeptide-forming pilin-related protein [Pseudobutyrivibrio sp. 49]SDH95959.1 LPXTG-motif cell wall anchor domain-containing protein/fibro-slime domain-containing protein [Pseudobutyrivibrio sp. 49]
MKRYPILRRLLCINLSVVMLFSTQVAVYAAESGGGSIRQETISNTEEGNTEDSSTKESSKKESNTKESNTKQSNTNSEDISTNLSNTQINSEEVSSKKENSKTDNNRKDSKTDEELQENADSEEASEEKKKSEDETFNIKKGDFYISAFVPAGTFDVDVEFKADQVKLTSSEKELVSQTVDADEMEDYYAFDLRFEADGEEIEPREGSSVKVSIESSLIETDAVVHIKDDETAETIESDITEEVVSFEAESFSVYVLTAGSKKLGDKDFYNNPVYGSASANQSHTKETDTLDGGYKKDRFAVKIYQQNNFKIDKDTGELACAPYELAPNDNGKVFIYGTNRSEHFDFHFEAPINYYVAKVSLYETTSDDFYKKNPTQVVNVDGYKASCDVSLTLKRMTNNYRDDDKANKYKDKIFNAVVVELEPMPSFFTGQSQYVTGATLVNYINGSEYGKVAGNENKTFGDQFMFGSGQTGVQSNHCSYGQVYQGLAANDISNGKFRLANDNGIEIFPNYNDYSSDKESAKKYSWHWKKYSYINNYYNNASVQFNLDKEGYWTLDSSQYKYIYNEKTNRIEGIKGTEFRPFKGTDGKFTDNHFGMILPINFCVAEDGKTTAPDGQENDTIFKFFGDDDVFVYVDGKLVLDLGGVHNAVRGQINFRTGEILIQGDRENQLTSSLNETCYAPGNWGGVAKQLGTSNLYSGLISERDVKEFSQKEHVLTVVYFERGAHESNCKISYNFTKTETRTVDFKGLKVDENKNGLANAQFTLFTDEACTNVANMGIGIPAVVTSDGDGTISFTGLSAGVIEKGQNSVTKIYYMRETSAPEGYNKPINALWKLELTAYSDGSQSQKLYALDAEAQNLSFGDYWSTVYGPGINVKAIKNNPIRFAKKLTVAKKVTYGSEENKDKDAQYVFVISQVVGQVHSYLANQPYKIGDKEYKTNEYAQFVLKAGEVAVFENLMETQYEIEETYVLSSNGYTLGNYDTKITVDDEATVKFYRHDDADIKRIASIDFESIGENNVKSVVSEKAAEFENNLVKIYDWQLMKISKTSQLPLAGAEFTLASTKKGSTDKYYGKSDANGVVLWYKSVSDRDNNNNPIEVSVGSYTLSETKAPGGYSKSEDVWQITIDMEHGVQAYINNQGDLKDKTVVEEQTLSNGGVLKTVKLSFENQVAYTLPATGGSGIHLYTIGGVLLLLLASLLLYKDKKKYI